MEASVTKIEGVLVVIVWTWSQSTDPAGAACSELALCTTDVVESATAAILNEQRRLLLCLRKSIESSKSFRQRSH